MNILLAFVNVLFCEKIVRNIISFKHLMEMKTENLWKWTQKIITRAKAVLQFLIVLA